MRPTLEYASPAWDPSTSEEVTKLEKVQRQAARLSITTIMTPGCVSKMVSDIGWESLQHRRRVDRLTTLYKIQYGLVELDTDVVCPGDKRTRGQHRLPASCQVVHLQELLHPTNHPGMEPPSNISHWCHHHRGVKSRRGTCPTGPPAVTLSPCLF